MASLEELRAKFQKASEENQRAYDAWNDENAADNVKATYERAIRKGDKKTAAIFKERYMKLSAAYKKTQEEKNRLKKELTAAEKVESEKKTSEAKAKGAVGSYEKALKDLAIADANLGGYNGEKNYTQAWLAAEAALNDVVKSGKTPSINLPEPSIEIIRPEQTTTTDGTTKTQTSESVAQGISDYKNIAFSSSENIKSTQQELKKFGYTGPVNGKWSKKLDDALNQALLLRATAPEYLRGKDIQEFLVAPQVDISGAGGPKVTRSISTDVEAAAYIDAAVKSELGRAATSAEIKSLSAALKAYEKANPTITSDGTTSGGASPQAYLVQLIRGQQKVVGKTGTKTATKLAAEFTTKKDEAQKLVSQDLMSTLAANGLEKLVGQDQLNTWAKRIQKGEKADTIKNEIRMLAATGMPENVVQQLKAGVDLKTVYAPYRSAMASVLELDPNSINMNDPVLRNAIGPNGSVPLYDFQRALRQDSRWQYTNNAREEVSDSVMQVLKDFGFRG